MAFIKLLLNFSLIFSLLVAPSLLLIAYGYRRQMTGTLLVWRRPELVLVTIAFSVMALILFVVGVSCFFSYGGYLDSPQIRKLNPSMFLNLGITCMFFGVGLLMAYMAIRLVLVQIITDRGIVLNDRFLRIPNHRNQVEWHEIFDYYLVSDYPNVIYNFIIQRQAMDFERAALRVPVYIREDFEKMLENRMYSASAMRARARMSRHKFSEN